MWYFKTARTSANLLLSINTTVTLVYRNYLLVFDCPAANPVYMAPNTISSKAGDDDDKLSKEWTEMKMQSLTDTKPQLAVYPATYSTLTHRSLQSAAECFNSRTTSHYYGMHFSDKPCRLTVGILPYNTTMQNWMLSHITRDYGIYRITPMMHCDCKTCYLMIRIWLCIHQMNQADSRNGYVITTAP